MKLRLLALSAMLLTLTYATPRVFAQAQPQAQGSPAPSDQPSSDSAPKSTAPAPANPADPDKVKHDGGKEDVDAVGNRNVGCKTGHGQLVWRGEADRHGQAICPCRWNRASSWSRTRWSRNT